MKRSTSCSPFRIGQIAFTLKPETWQAQYISRYVAGYQPNLVAEHTCKVTFAVQDERTLAEPFEPEQTQSRLAFGSAETRVWDEGATRWAVTREGGKHYVASFRAGGLSVLASTEQSSAVHALRAMRDISRTHHVNRGQTVWHAGALVLERRGVLIVGESGAGKTSVTGWGCLAPGAAFIANDRVLLDLAGEAPVAYALPLSINVGGGTVRSVPQLHVFVTSHVMMRHGRTVPVGEIPDQRGSRTKVEFTPGEFTKALGCSWLPEVAIGLVVLPRIAGGDSPPVARMASNSAAAAQAMLPSCYTPDDPTWPEPWLGNYHPGRDEQLGLRAAAALTLARSVPVVEVTVGTGWLVRHGAAFTDFLRVL